MVWSATMLAIGTGLLHNKRELTNTYGVYMKLIKQSGFAAITFFFAVAAIAQETPQEASSTVAVDCKADLQTFCRDVKAGGGRLLQCLNANHEKLSDSCKNALTAAAAADKARAKPPH
jgi:hypothetical protein